MLTARDARDVARKANAGGMAEVLARYEREIEDEARIGRRSAMLDYCDCCDGDKRAAMRELGEQGFRIAEYCDTVGGVRQSRAYYAEW